MDSATHTHNEQSKYVNFDEAIKICFNKFATFTGVASRSEFWWWTLFTLLVSIAVGFAGSLPFNNTPSFTNNMLQNAWNLIVFVPSLAVGVRRLRDAGFSWAYLFFMLLPFIGWAIVIILWIMPSKHSK